MGNLARNGGLAANEAADEQAIVAGEALGWIFNSACEFTRLGERSLGLGRGIAAGGNKRVAKADLQIKLPFAPCRCDFTSSVSASPASSDCACSISGNASVGEKPSSAGARTAWASAARPVD